MHAATCMYVDCDFVAYMQNEIGRTLQPPLHVGNIEMSADLKILSLCLDFNRKRYLMIHSVQSKLA